ncbi:tryptophan oxygenase [Capsaspora owczarzaki ATCC 30864]|uniref:Tryptophan 2,3-dioxygenase n=1 Tax=Capsaspora owczarzaki (strain ATCC 30864) TaxID=595528 RepID=A0A0D2W0B9_CAPO3|nr:tryptophan oxygenase [Capsaspora owczarzaki ATCC 30864]KJE97617.1 tryptophan oxygenase [Capsaspora owczarzaki ATCC 30864]|eukprot:XP_004343304.2 tryptophan oxygenase [Capsaspora owczarzaki ATCC 30864]
MACPFQHGSVPATRMPLAAAIAVTTSSGAASESAGTSTSDAASSGERQPVYYGDYLRLGTLLSLQQPESTHGGTRKAAHDEHLFIVIHQVYELWFKQILHELESIREIFSTDHIKERDMLTIVNRLGRVVEIEKIMVDQINILETMTALDFMEFRDYLVPASGFQSSQFRVLETLLGLRPENRTRYSQETYWNAFSDDDAGKLREAEGKRSFLELMERWLERTPGLHPDEFDFWSKYKAAVNDILAANRAQVDHAELTPETRQAVLAECDKNELSFQSVFDPAKHAELREKGERRLSHKAMQGAIMIFLYRDEPRFHLPFKMLNLLMDVDAFFSKWRYQHVMMVHRMIGNKLGTGGSSGYQYLRSTISDKYRIFIDLFNISTYLIPRSKTPPLSESMARKLNVFME